MKKPDVLVLNRSYIPIHIIDWGKAMSLIYQETSRPLDRDLITYSYEDWLVFSQNNEEYPLVKTIKYAVAVPEIIVLRDYDRLPIRDVKYSRQTLFQRDHFKCAYCGGHFDKRALTVDHINPRDRGGKTTWENTITACKACNMKKGNKTLAQAGMKLLYHPRKPKWISPIAGLKKEHPCKSWQKFLDRTLVDAGD